MSNPSTPGLIVSDSGPIATIELDRPEDGNGINADMMAALPIVLRRLGAIPEVKAIAIRARGASFCRGQRHHRRIAGTHERLRIPPQARGDDPDGV